MPRRYIQNDPNEAPQAQRLDVWLFRTRLFKTRSLATKTVRKGKIRMNRNGKTSRTTKPNALLRPGDKVLFMRGETLIHIEMLSAALRRGPYSEARTLYKIMPLDISQ